VPPDQWLLHNGASSVLGRELIAMARRRGTKLINMVRRREAVAELAQLGCATTLFGNIASVSRQRVCRSCSDGSVISWHASPFCIQQQHAELQPMLPDKALASCPGRSKRASSGLAGHKLCAPQRAGRTRASAAPMRTPCTGSWRSQARPAALAHAHSAPQR